MLIHTTTKPCASLSKNGFSLKPDQLVHIAEKEWGHEEWIVNKPEYCGKKLVFNAGFQCSMHQHKIKDETFYIQSGKIILESEYQNNHNIRIMTAGDVMHIPTGMWHRIIAIENSEVLEFSTFHREDDSYRRTSSGRADLSAFEEYLK
jgi:quercetin dioxygenase-like cupin family protein